MNFGGWPERESAISCMSTGLLSSMTSSYLSDEALLLPFELFLSLSNDDNSDDMSTGALTKLFFPSSLMGCSFIFFFTSDSLTVTSSSSSSSTRFKFTGLESEFLCPPKTIVIPLLYFILVFFT